MKRQPDGLHGPANPAAGRAPEIAATGSAHELAAVAAATFPLACPPSVDPADVAAFVAANLSPECFAGYLADPERVVLVARHDGRVVGYAMLIRRFGESRVVELSKMYVLPEYHRSPTATALMRAGLEWADEQGAESVWLGVNQGNVRAQRFYAKHGFTVTGTRSFRLGDSLEEDFVMERRV